MTAPQRVRCAAAVPAMLLLVGALWPTTGGGPLHASLQGAALWSGDLPLTARIAGHDHALPPKAARCINCHGGVADAVARGGSPTGTAPQLTDRHLRGAVARRGGPPSRYDAAAFCALLRTGVDPTSVLLPRHMPRYAVSDAECTALWRHLTRGAA